MASIGEQIVAAMVAALNASPSKPATCYRSRVDAFAAPELPAMVLYNVRERIIRKSQHNAYRQRTVRLEVLCAGPPPVDALIDPLFIYATQALWNDPSFGGLDLGLEPVAAIWEEAPGYPDVAMAAFDFDFIYVTKLDDPTQKGSAA